MREAMVRRISKESALDLTIKGSIGEFAVSRQGSNSVPVKYILSSVGLTFEGNNEQKMMQNMKPVREVFDLKELDFEQIMQRDIDDSRVSKDLIPYVLDSKNTGLVKLFPPIVIVLVPRKEGLPLDYFPPLESIDQPDEGFFWKILRSGPTSKESFEFKQMVEDGEPNRHDYAQLKINTSNTELVIVDGQHRAMALIALFRNLNNSWPDNTSHHETFYKHWTKDTIRQFDLNGIRLPAIFCVFPDLNEYNKNNIEYTVPKACRSIFLALNRNARKVTTARNYLLEDNDLVPLLLRSTLSRIKNLNLKTKHNFRLWSVELDATEDRTKLTSDVSVTGVMPLYNMLENVLLYNKSLHGFYGKKSNLHKISNIGKLLKRINADEKLTSEEIGSTKRNSFDDKTSLKIKTAFEDRIYPIIEKGYSSFLPFSIHLDKFHDLKSKEEPNNTVHAILFEGQGLSSVFNSHIKYLSKEISDNSEMPSEFKKALVTFKSTQEYIDEKLEHYRKNRNIVLHGKWIEDADFHKEADSIYSNTFLTSAFQTALFMTFFSIVDNHNELLEDTELHKLFDEYIDSVNKTFEKDSHKPYKVFEMFLGAVNKDDDGNYKYYPTSYCIKKLLIPGEMKPDEWTSFRYFFLECWKSSNENINNLIFDDVIQCRKDVLKKYINREIQNYLNENRIEQKDLAPSKYDEIVKDCAQKLDDALNSARSKHKERGQGNLENLYHQKIKEDSLDETEDEQDD